MKPIIPSVYQYQWQVYRQDFPWWHSRLGFVPLVVPQPRPWPHGPHAEDRPRGPLAVPWHPLFIRRSPRRHPRGGGRVPGFVAVPPQARTSYTFSAVVPNHSRASPYVTIHMHSPLFFSRCSTIVPQRFLIEHSGSPPGSRDGSLGRACRRVTQTRMAADPTLGPFLRGYPNPQADTRGGRGTPLPPRSFLTRQGR